MPAIVDVRHGRYVTEHISGARYVELEGEHHLPLAGDTDAVDKEIERFLSGLTSFGQAPDLDRVLATVLFIEIVGSTERAAALGDQKWKEIIAVHNDQVRKELVARVI